MDKRVRYGRPSALVRCHYFAKLTSLFQLSFPLFNCFAGDFCVVGLAVFIFSPLGSVVGHFFRQVNTKSPMSQEETNPKFPTVGTMLLADSVSEKNAYLFRTI
jgi:hypothetical protein